MYIAYTGTFMKKKQLNCFLIISDVKFCKQRSFRVQQKDRRSVPKKCRAVITKLSGRTPGDNNHLCNKCRCMCYYHLRQKEHPKLAKTQDRGRPEVLSAPPFSPPSVTLPFHVHQGTRYVLHL